METVLVDGKYHIASLVAVFLALGLGIVIGATVFRDDTLVRRQEIMISRLEQQFDALKAERESLQAKVAVLERESNGHAQFTSAVKRFLIEDQLRDRHIAVVSCVPLTATQKQVVKQLMHQAGAEITGFWQVGADWMDKAWPRRDEAKQMVSALGWSEEPLQTAVALGLAQHIAAAPKELVSEIEELEIAKVSELTGETADTVLLVSFPDNTPGLHATLVDAFLALDLLVAVVPAPNGENNVPAEIREREIIIVDSLESDLGQIALVQAIAHRKPGYFSSSPSSQVLPNMPGKGKQVPVTDAVS